MTMKRMLNGLLKKPEYKENVLASLESSFRSMIEEINQKTLYLDLSDCVKANHDGKPINLTDLIQTNSHLCSVILEFDESSQLTHCGGLQFFQD